MSGHHLFGELRARMTPERRARNKAAAESMNSEYVLSQIRQQLGLSQADMAERLGVSQPTYCEYERGGNMRIGTLQKIVGAFGGSLKLQIVLDGREYPLQFARQLEMA